MLVVRGTTFPVAVDNIDVISVPVYRYTPFWLSRIESGPFSRSVFLTPYLEADKVTRAFLKNLDPRKEPTLFQSVVNTLSFLHRTFVFIDKVRIKFMGTIFFSSLAGCQITIMPSM